MENINVLSQHHTRHLYYLQLKSDVRGGDASYVCSVRRFQLKIRLQIKFLSVSLEICLFVFAHTL